MSESENQITPEPDPLPQTPQVRPVEQVENVLQEEAPEILQPKRQEIARRVVTVAAQQFSGPLPPPFILAEYEKVVPGSAALIIARAEKQSDHRMMLEAAVVPSQQKESERGQRFGFAIAVIGLIISGACIMTGHEVSGSVLGGVDLLGMVALFVTGKVIQARDLQKKQGDETESKPQA